MSDLEKDLKEYYTKTDIEIKPDMQELARLKAKFEEEKKAAMPRKSAPIPRTKGYTPFEGLGDLFSQDNE